MEETKLIIGGGVALNPCLPFVDIQIGDDYVRVSPNTARYLALQILEAAEKASQDASVIEFFMEKHSMSEEDAIKASEDIDTYREKQQALIAQQEANRDSGVSMN